MSGAPCVHGVRVYAPSLPLSESPAEFDRTLSLLGVSEGAVPVEPFPNELAGTSSAELGYSVAADSSFFRVRHFGCCEFEIARQSLEGRWQRDPREPAALCSLLFVNSVLGAILEMQGEIVLHASAIARGPGCLLFAAPSGQGKSTLAALGCSVLGAELLADDACRIEQRDAPMAYPGARELRLRPAAEPLGGHPTWGRRRLVDERLAVSPRPHLACSRIAAIWCPAPTDGGQVRLAPLGGAAAVHALLQATRTAWHPQAGARHVRLLSQLARQVAVLRVELPSDWIERRQCHDQLVALMSQALPAAPGWRP